MKKWIELNLRSVGQVMFQDGPVAGLFILFGILWASSVGGEPSLAAGALLGLFLGNFTGLLLKVDRKYLQQGFYGYNGILIGIAVLTLFRDEPLTWIFLGLGSVASSFVMWGVTEKLKPTFRFPILTFPFVLITWIIFLVLLKTAPGLIKIAPAISTASADYFQFHSHAIFKSFSEVFLLDSVVTGGFFILALLVSSSAAAGFAIFGALIALGVTILVGINVQSIEAGIWGFNAVLTAIAIGSVFFKPSLRSVVAAFFAVLLTILIQSGLGFLFGKWGLPIFTAPFVFATWIALGCKRIRIDTDFVLER